MYTPVPSYDKNSQFGRNTRKISLNTAKIPGKKGMCPDRFLPQDIPEEVLDEILEETEAVDLKALF